MPERLDRICYRVFAADQSGLTWAITVAAADRLEARDRALVLFPDRQIRGVVEAHPVLIHDAPSFHRPMSFAEALTRLLIDRRRPKGPDGDGAHLAETDLVPSSDRVPPPVVHVDRSSEPTLEAPSEVRSLHRSR